MKIKILHIIKSLGRGGAEMLLPETLKLHDIDQFEFHYIYFLPWKNQMVTALEEAGAKVSCFSAGNNIQLMRQKSKVQAYIKEHDIQLIHAHLPWAGFLGRFIHKQTNIPLIYTEHNKQERYHRLTYLLNKLTFNWQSQVIAVSKDVEKSILTNIHPKIEVDTILNGVNTFQFKRKTKEEVLLSIKLKDKSLDQTSFNSGKEDEIQFDASEEVIKEIIERKYQSDCLVLGTVAVFRFQKRLLEWIQVFKEASELNPNLLGVIVGNGPLATEMIKLRSQLDLEGKLFFPGLQTNIRDWLSVMDVFMMTSEFEGLPIALLEAMSMECAIASTDAGGIKEVIEDNENGLIVKVQEWSLLIKKLDELKNPELRKKLSINARKRVLETFSLEAMVNQLEDLYVVYGKK